MSGSCRATPSTRWPSRTTGRSPTHRRADSTARGFALLACEAPIAHRAPGIGLGEEIRFAANGVSGSGLAHEGELIHLSVFPGTEGSEVAAEEGPRQGRVRRPSRRRGR